jgi:hypothetical protein
VVAVSAGDREVLFPWESRWRLGAHNPVVLPLEAWCRGGGAPSRDAKGRMTSEARSGYGLYAVSPASGAQNCP